MNIEVKPYRRNWAIYVNGELLAVVVYKKGAAAIVSALQNRGVAE